MTTPSPGSQTLLLAVFTICVACMLGCDQAPSSSAADGNSFEQLTAIAESYMKFEQDSGNPPASAEDLTQALADAGHEPDVLVSKRDNQSFVVLWGTPIMTEGDPIVIAYEATTSNDNRMVLTTMGAMSMTEAEFRDIKFPDGHSPPTPSQTP